MLWSAHGRLAAVQARVGVVLGARVGIEVGQESIKAENERENLKSPGKNRRVWKKSENRISDQK